MAIASSGAGGQMSSVTVNKELDRIKNITVKTKKAQHLIKSAMPFCDPCIRTYK
jgi:hypothetical protein